MLHPVTTKAVEMDIPRRFSIKTTEKETLSHWFHLMVLGRALDDRAPNYLKQAIGWSYHAPYAGHDGIQLAIGQVFNSETDHLFPYYRDMLTCLSADLQQKRSFTTEFPRILMWLAVAGICQTTLPNLNGTFTMYLPATGNHTLHAAGVGRAMKKYGH